MLAGNPRLNGNPVPCIVPLARAAPWGCRSVLPGFRWFTPSPHCRTIPDASWPIMQSPSKTSDPMRPDFQKWISEPQMPVALTCSNTSPLPGA